MLKTNFASAQNDTINVYLIPGQGADYRLFNTINLGENYRLIPIHCHTPNKGTSMAEYARQLFQQIDTSQQYILIGVSLGGMLAVEINELHQAYKTIIISSAKSRNELPVRYRFQKHIPIYKWISPKANKKGALILQPIVEPDRNKQKETFIAMLNDKDPLFLNRTIAMILEWERTTYPEGITHIHGEKDKTIPIKNIDCNYLIKGGSHMMVLTRGEEISKLLLQILKE